MDSTLVDAVPGGIAEKESIWDEMSLLWDKTHLAAPPCEM